MRNSDNEKWNLPEFKKLGKNSKYLHGYLFDVSDNAGFFSNDSDELFVKTKLTEVEQEQSLEQLEEMKFIVSGTMGMYLVLNVWQSATGGIPVLNESKLAEGSIKGILKNGTHSNQWKQIEKKHKYFSPETIKDVFKLFFDVIKKESYSEELATFLTLGNTLGTTPNLNTTLDTTVNNTLDTIIIPKPSSNTSTDSTSIIDNLDFMDDIPKVDEDNFSYTTINNPSDRYLEEKTLNNEKSFKEKELIRKYTSRGKSCETCGAKFNEECKVISTECTAGNQIKFIYQ